jgi:hypothetical protein
MLRHIRSVITGYFLLLQITSVYVTLGQIMLCKGRFVQEGEVS